MRNENLIAFEKRSGLFLNPVNIAATILVFIIGILGMGDKFQLGMLVLPVILVVILPGLAKKSLESVVLDPTNGEGVIVLNRWGRVHKRIKIPIVDLNVSYKDELSMKGIKRKVLRLFHKKLLIAAVFSGEGWDAESLEGMAAAINELKGSTSNA
ncbi:hypothetical protein [Chitinophaga sp. CF418]|uniref:hypothetical protein n=1 Tax=Chitinophaga sp. CF418 TaxID=1855287 RepID=UPI000920F6FB|nr:hypothetical protein [Chitinophaga sp. CF418]SHN44004.1 hypothetical protein SAMN05216311_116166 [Chitinophaga sp. CF418]